MRNLDESSQNIQYNQLCGLWGLLAEQYPSDVHLPDSFSDRNYGNKFQQSICGGILRDLSVFCRIEFFFSKTAYTKKTEYQKIRYSGK